MGPGESEGSLTPHSTQRAAPGEGGTVSHVSLLPASPWKLEERRADEDGDTCQLEGLHEVHGGRGGAGEGSRGRGAGLAGNSLSGRMLIAEPQMPAPHSALPVKDRAVPSSQV